ncbi:TOX high mobility group box family member 4-like isoform X2 [Stegodyphus dumicola]|uniref:TOX high mobility group box family member 4-like isoform X2 n=1 Tax=Stegodyphus dumicola TaxID=202533 RepID=UPI0015B07140|nr:TOX high mobility group box family member 4-like isoform X2 [Stegodyphus dumicola]
MSVDQTFHTPSFGDEEFEIPPLTYAPTAAATRCSGQGVFGNQVPVEYLKRKLSCDQIYVYLPRHEENFTDCRIYNQHPLSHLRPPESILQQQQQQGYIVHPSNSPQGHIMNNNHNQFHNSSHQQQQQSRGPQDMYQNEMMNSHSMGMQMQYEDHSTYSDASMQQGSMHPPQMTIMQQQPQQNHVMGPPQQQMFSTINQSQISSQLGLQIGMGPVTAHQGTGSPPGSNHTSPGLETSEDSDDSTPLAQLIGTMKRPTPEPVDTTVPKVTKKPKAQKKKKKRDPNEPQKPVSAYALFFRDTQAAIKGQQPNASFGEVSKIVAAMWDALDVDQKNSYKKKTETAKKEYLKALAAYRATLVSKQSPQHMTNNNSPPHVMQQGNGMMNMHQQQQQQQQQQMQPQMSPQQQMNVMNNRPQVLQIPGNSPQMCNSASNSPTYNQNISSVSTGGGHSNMNSGEMMPSLPTCLRNGCPNPAIDSPDWDREYCSSECVVSHCKDVFVTWVAQRQVPANPYSTVK